MLFISVQLKSVPWLRPRSSSHSPKPSSHVSNHSHHSLLTSAAVVVRVLESQGAGAASISVLSNGLSALENLAYSDRNKQLLAEARACECK